MAGDLKHEIEVDEANRLDAESVQSCPLVSVIIPAYNYEDYVAETIDSVLAQTYPNIEVVVVDDGSTDGTAQVVAGFGSRVRYEKKSNGGLATARNFGIERARGDLLVFLDADDLLVPEAVETMERKFAELGESYALVAARFAAIDGKGTRLEDQQVLDLSDREISYEDLLLRSRFCPAVMVRRDVMMELGMFDTGFGTAEQGSEDRDMWIRIAAQHRVYRLHQCLVRKREHEVNMSSNGARQTASARRTLAKAREAGVVSHWNLRLWGSVYAVQHHQSAIMYRESGDYRAALREIVLSFVVLPWFCRNREADLPIFFRLRHLWVVMKLIVSGKVDGIAERDSAKK